MNNSLTNARNYWDTLSKGLPFDKKDHWVDERGDPLDDALFEEIADWISSSFLHPSTPCKILEIGCGTGRIAKHLKSISEHFEIVGIDISEQQINSAKEHCSDVTFICSDVIEFASQRYDCNLQQYDLIYLHSVTQYFPSSTYLTCFLESTRKILRHGGSLVMIDVPISWYMNQMMDDKGNNTLSIKSMLKRLLPESVGCKLRRCYRLLSPVVIEESFGNMSIKVPFFDPYWVDPEIVKRFADKNYSSYQMSYQPFLNKPLSYIKYRPIISLLGRK